MVKDEWGLICLKEKVGEFGYTMDDSLGYFIGTEVGLQELVKDFDFWNLVNQSYNPKMSVLVVEMRMKIEESDDVNDDEEFVKNVDMNAEYGGLGLTFKDKGEFREAITTYAIKEGKEMKYEKNDKVTIEPDVITQPEVSDNQWEIPDDILDAQWDQILLQTQDEIPVIKVPYLPASEHQRRNTCVEKHMKQTKEYMQRDDKLQKLHSKRTEKDLIKISRFLV
nr:uncharacterized protein LOC109185271 [Ipomoea batatas]